MKLRNKKTGEVVDVESLGHAESLKEKYGYQVTLSWAAGYENLSQCRTYKTLAELNEEWEDYKPKEPFIKDEKIRKAVKVWAEANHVKRARIVGVGTLRCERTGVDIEFDGAPFVGWVTELKTIAELCGEDDDEA